MTPTDVVAFLTGEAARYRDLARVAERREASLTQQARALEREDGDVDDANAARYDSLLALAGRAGKLAFVREEQSKLLLEAAQKVTEATTLLDYASL